MFAFRTDRGSSLIAIWLHRVMVIIILANVSFSWLFGLNGFLTEYWVRESGTFKSVNHLGILKVLLVPKQKDQKHLKRKNGSYFVENTDFYI